MSRRTARRIAQHTTILGSIAALVVACGGQFGGLGGATTLNNAACPELMGGAANASFEADAHANATIRAFVTAAGDLEGIAARAEAEVGGACERMGHDLGIAPAQMAPRGNENRVAAACNAVNARIDGILRAGASAQIKADVTPPQCEVRADLDAACRGQCNVSVDPGYVKAHCAPGHLYGRCEGTCSGTCAGTCEGECAGQCAGQAQAAGGTAAANGKCAGHCNGTCRGHCSADCHGGCTVDYKEPKCDIAVQAPSADAHCEGSCKAHADLSARCTEARVNIQAAVSTGELPILIATLRANLPALITAEIAYGRRIAADIEILVRTGGELPNAFGRLTAHAGACIAAAANATVAAQASLHVSVQASASISAKAGAHGGV